MTDKKLSGARAAPRNAIPLRHEGNTAACSTKEVRRCERELVEEVNTHSASSSLIVIPTK